jgi:hypothetical protein
MSMKHYRSALTAVVNFLDELEALLISFRPDDYRTNGYITIPPRDTKYYEVCVQRKELWNTYAWFQFKKNESLTETQIMTDGVDTTQQKLKMRDLYRSISEIDLYKLTDGGSHYQRITSAKTEALSALSTWFTENGFTSWFEENRLAEEDKSTEHKSTEHSMPVVFAHDEYVEEVKDRLLSLYKQLYGGCNDPQKILTEKQRLENECKTNVDRLNLYDAYRGLQNGCTDKEKLSDGYKKVVACVEIFWYYKGGLHSNVPVWQQGWQEREMTGDRALRLIGEQVRPMLEAAVKEDGGIKNWYLRGLIGTELAYIETGLLAKNGSIEPPKPLRQHGNMHVWLRELSNLSL